MSTPDIDQKVDSLMKYLEEKEAIGLVDAADWGYFRGGGNFPAQIYINGISNTIWTRVIKCGIEQYFNILNCRKYPYKPGSLTIILDVKER